MTDGFHWYNAAVGKTDGNHRSHLEGEMRVGWKMAGIGMEVAAQVAAGALLGWLFDLWRGTEPVGILTGSIAGILVGMWSLIKGTLRLNRQLDRQHPTAGRGRPLPPDDDAQETDGWKKD